MVVQELIAKLGFDVDQGGLDKADNALGGFVAKLGLAALGLYAVKKAAEAAAWAISGSIDAAAQKEDVTTQFKVMLGDLEAAKYLYQEINQYAAVSPFETAGLADNVRMMMSFGMSAKNAFADVKVLGDVALGSQTKLNSLALAYSQTKAAGRLTGNDLLQYTNAGFNPLEYIAKKKGKSADYWKQEMSKGKVSFDMVRQAFVDATSAGGKFYKGAEEGSKTWNGMLSTLRDNIRMLGAELGDKMLPFFKEMLKKFSELWVNIRGSWIALSEFFGIMFANGPTATEWAEGFAWAFQSLADSIMFLGLMWQSFVVDLQMLKVVVYGLGGVVADVLRYIGMIFARVLEGMYRGLAYIGEHLGIESLQAFGSKEAKGIRTDLDKDFGTFKTVEWGGSALTDLKGSLAKQLAMAEKIGTQGAPAKQITETDRIKEILSKGAGKQPLTINNQTNNLTINADDPIKTMGEAAAGRFFQSAFIQLRHATV